MPETRYVFPGAAARRYRFPTHVNDLILDRAEAATAEAFFVVLAPGEAPPRHHHPDTEQIFYVLEGRGVLEIGEPCQRLPVQVGDLVRVPPGVPHRIQAHGDATLRYLCVDCFVGGRPTHEPTWDEHVRAACAQNDWNFDQVQPAA